MSHKTTINLFIILLLILMIACSRESSQSPHGVPPAGNSRQITEPSIPGYAPVEIDPGRVQLMGITTVRVSSRHLIKTLRTVGIVEVDERRVAQVHTKFSGWIDELYVNFTGQSVKAGQPLFSIYSPELLTTGEEYLLSLQDMDRVIEGPFAEQARRGARELSSAARRRLELMDIPASEIDQLARTRKLRQTLTLNSPRTGVVIEKNAFKGMNVEPGMNLFVIADLSRVWVQADIYEQDMSYVRPGQTATLVIDALPGESFKGTVNFIGPVIDERTRTVKARLEFNNPKQLLKPGMYATVELKLDLGRSLTVPDDAIIDTGQRKVVFIARGGGRFEPREVRLGNKVDNFYTVLSGLSENELVATGAQFFLDSESRLKAVSGGGMAGHEGMGKGK